MRRRDNLEARQRKAREHPVRRKILDLYEQDTDRSLRGRDLLPDLQRDGGLKCSLHCVAYHLGILRDAELLPTPLAV